MSLTDQIQWQPDIQPSGNFYDTPDGRFPRITHVLDEVLNLGKADRFSSWSGWGERDKCVSAATEAYYQAVLSHHHTGEWWHRDEFTKTMRAKLGRLFCYEKKEEAADVGTEAHEAIKRYREGEKIGTLSGPATVAFQAAVKYMESRKLEPVRTEKNAWVWWPFGNERHGWGCTLDCVDMGPDGYEINEWKSAKGIFRQNHLQVAAQAKALTWSGIEAAQVNLIRLPKSLDDPLLKSGGIEVIPAGRIYVYDEKRWIDRPLSRLMLAARQAVEIYYCLRDPQ